METWPREIVVECRSDNLSLAYGMPLSSNSSKGQLDMALWKKIVNEISQSAPLTPVRVVYYGSANMITGYRLYYILRYAKRAGLGQVTLRTDGGFWLEESSDWLIDAGVDRIEATLDSMPDDFAALPVFARIAEIESAKRSREISSPRIEIHVPEGKSQAVGMWWSQRDPAVFVCPQIEPQTTHQRVPCRYALETCTIDWRGEMIACPLDTHADFVAGKLMTETIANLWNGTHRDLAMRHSERRFDQLTAPCINCTRWIGTE